MYNQVMVLAALVASFLVFPDTTSPSGRFVVAWRDPSHEYTQADMSADTLPTDFDPDHVQNMLVTDTGRVVTIIQGMQGFPHENHGGMIATYNQSESLVAINHDGKWAPREIVAISTSSGVQVDVIKAGTRALARYAMAHRGKFTRQEAGNLVYPVDKMFWVGNRLHLHVDAAIIKDERNWSVPMEEILTFKNFDSNLKVTSVTVEEARP